MEGQILLKSEEHPLVNGSVEELVFLRTIVACIDRTLNDPLWDDSDRVKQVQRLVNLTMKEV